jgi:hypothetical protein
MFKGSDERLQIQYKVQEISDETGPDLAHSPPVGAFVIDYAHTIVTRCRPRPRKPCTHNRMGVGGLRHVPVARGKSI